MKAKFVLAAVSALMIAGAANATTVTYSSSGSFSNISGCTSGFPSCSIYSTGGGTNNGLDMSGFNNSYLVANNVSGSVNVPPNDLGQVVGNLTWTNNASTNTDQNFNVNYTFKLSFNGSPDTQVFTLNIQQPTNPPGDTVLNLSNSTLSGIGPYSIAGVSISNIRFALAAGTTHSTYDGTNWKLDEGFTRSLDILADITSTATPEPASMALLGTGLVGLGIIRRRRARQA